MPARLAQKWQRRCHKLIPRGSNYKCPSEPRDRACLCRQGIPRPRCPKPAPRLHLRPKTRVFGRIKRELTRRSAIEAVIGHMKAEGHLGRCYLKGRAGDAANVILSAVGYNLRLVLAWLRIILRVILLALLQTFTIQPALKPAS